MHIQHIELKFGKKGFFSGGTPPPPHTHTHTIQTIQSRHLTAYSGPKVQNPTQTLM